MSKHNGEYQGWSEIDEEDLTVWLADGSLHEGDKIIYPKIVKTVVENKTLELV